MAAPYDFSAARKAIVDELGRDTIARLHKTRPLFDWLASATLWTVLAGLVYALATLPFGALWIFCFVLQGFVIMSFGYLMHELGVHRQLGGKTFSQCMGAVAARVANLDLTSYAHVHHDHHDYTGVEPDQPWLQDLDTRWKRAFFLTWVGYELAFRRLLRGKRGRYPPGPEGAFQPFDDDKPKVSQFRRERLFRLCWWIGLGIAAIFWPRWVLLGYVGPLFIMLPVANGLRVVLEHAEANPANLFHCGTYYRTGVFTRVLFGWDAGDCHLVHHIFPLIPFYRMGEAADLMRPFLLRHGVRERRSLLKLLYGYFIKNEPHRALWSA